MHWEGSWDQPTLNLQTWWQALQKTAPDPKLHIDWPPEKYKEKEDPTVVSQTQHEISN